MYTRCDFVLNAAMSDPLNAAKELFGWLPVLWEPSSTLGADKKLLHRSQRKDVTIRENDVCRRLPFSPDHHWQVNVLFKVSPRSHYTASEQNWTHSIHWDVAPIVTAFCSLQALLRFKFIYVGVVLLNAAKAKRRGIEAEHVEKLETLGWLDALDHGVHMRFRASDCCFLACKCFIPVYPIEPTRKKCTRFLSAKCVWTERGIPEFDGCQHIGQKGSERKMKRGRFTLIGLVDDMNEVSVLKFPKSHAERSVTK